MVPPFPPPRRRRDSAYVQVAITPDAPDGCGATPSQAAYFAPERYNPNMSQRPPVCPTCGQPASEALGGPDHDWECRNEACPEFGQPVRADEPPPPDEA